MKVEERPWIKERKCPDCEDNNCPFDEYALWKDWFYGKLTEESELEELGEIALCELFGIIADLFME